MTEPGASAFERLLRRSLRGFSPYVRGTTAAEVSRRYGIDAPVKLSQNENPLGTSPRALAALREIDGLADYFEDDHGALRARLARDYGLSPENVVLGHGSNELVHHAFLAFVDPGDEVVMAHPSFSLFKKSADIFGARAVQIPLLDGVHDLESMRAAVTPRTKLVFVCDPNNPTGTRVERQTMLAFARNLEPGVLLVIDQAYREFMDAEGCDGVDVLRERPLTLVLRTASKIHGLAAMRLGYGYAAPEVVRALDAVRVPFNVARPAAAAVSAALDDADFQARSVENNERGKEFLYAAFARLGLHAYPTAANFIAVDVPREADEAYRELLERGVIVRSGASLGLPHGLRVSIGTPAQNAAFVAALESLVPRWLAAEAVGAAG